jgi:S1-C subfamily serine protease
MTIPKRRFRKRSHSCHRLAAFLAGLCLLGARASAAAPQPAQPCKTSIPDLYQQVSPAVVSITAISIDASEVTNRTERRTGSGVVVDASGLILTNSHVVYGQPIIEVTLDDQTTLPGRIVGVDPFFDIALVRVVQSPPTKLPTAHLGRSDGLHTGDEVFAIGNPFGLEQTFTRGIVSAVNRILPGVSWSSREPMIQTDAAINPGSSGGPLIDRCGEVVGITTAILPDAQGIGFAIPVDVIKKELPDLIEKGRVVRPWLGVQGQLVTPEIKELFRIPLVDGLLIEVVEADSPAALLKLRGGNLDVVIGGAPILLGGDVITEVDGRPIVDQKTLKAAFEDLGVGATVRLAVFREQKSIIMEAVVAERPMPTSSGPARRATASGDKPGSRAGVRFSF